MAATVRVGWCTNWCMACSWLTLTGLPESGVMPSGWHAAISERGRANVISLALALLDHLQDLRPSCLPRS